MPKIRAIATNGFFVARRHSPRRADPSLQICIRASIARNVMCSLPQHFPQAGVPAELNLELCGWRPRVNSSPTSTEAEDGPPGCPAPAEAVDG